MNCATVANIVFKSRKAIHDTFSIHFAVKNHKSLSTCDHTFQSGETAL